MVDPTNGIEIIGLDSTTVFTEYTQGWEFEADEALAFAAELVRAANEFPKVLIAIANTPKGEN